MENQEQEIGISVIMPVYNVEKYVGKAIESILSQTLKNFEFIIVDDGTPDRSGEICDEYAAKDSRIQVIHKENGGAPSARNISPAPPGWTASAAVITCSGHGRAVILQGCTAVIRKMYQKTGRRAKRILHCLPEYPLLFSDCYFQISPASAGSAIVSAGI